MTTPAELVAAAYQHDLGDLTEVHRGRRRISGLAGSIVAVLVAVAVVAALVARSPGLALTVLLAAAVAVLGYVYLIPPAGGRPGLGLGDDGLVVDLGRGPVPVRWGQITEVTYAPPPARTLTLKAGGDPIVIPLGLFGGSHGIMATVLRQTQPTVYRWARASVEHGGQATYPPLALTTAHLHNTDTGETLTWDAVESADAYGDGTLDVTPLDADHTGWTDLRPANPIACAALVNDLADPGTGTATLAAALSAADARARAANLSARNGVTVARIGTILACASLAIVTAVSMQRDPPAVHSAPAKPTAVPSDAPLPDDLPGYSAVCSGRTFTGAAQYTGPGPHPILVFGEFGAPSGERDLPAQWRATDVATAQLVACVRGTVANFAKMCDYEDPIGTGPVSVQLLYVDFEYTLYEIRTRRQVAVEKVRGENVTCAPVISYRSGTDPPQQTSKLNPSQVIAAMSQYVS